MKKIKLLVIIAFFLVTNLSHAAKIKTVEVFSRAMNTNCKASVITPDSYGCGSKPYPTVYLLHAYGGNHTQWTNKVFKISELVDQYKIIAVCPDAGRSWYLDSPVISRIKYETYITNELVNYIDENYRTIKDRKGRVITGASMGGHGSFFLAFRHKEIFGAAGSIMGGVDIRPFRGRWGLAALLGDISTHRDNWEKHTVINNTGLIKNGELALIFECGSNDIFIKENRDLHIKLLKEGIAHDYSERPGTHSMIFMKSSIKNQMLFFHKFFKK